MVGFPDAQLLDIAGPLKVFAATSRLLAFAGADNGEPAYDSVLAAPRPGPPDHVGAAGGSTVRRRGLIRVAPRIARVTLGCAHNAPSARAESCMLRP